jgi:hypothetical protein
LYSLDVVRVRASTNRPLIVSMSIGTMSFASEFQFAKVAELTESLNSKHRGGHYYFTGRFCHFVTLSRIF